MIDDPMERLASPVLTRLSIELDGRTCLARGKYTTGEPSILYLVAEDGPFLDAGYWEASRSNLHLEVWGDRADGALVLLITNTGAPDDEILAALDDLVAEIAALPTSDTLPGATGSLGGRQVRCIFLTKYQDSPVLLWERAA